MIETARRHDAGVFVLALTSNKEGPEVQHATHRRGRPSPARCSPTSRALNAGCEPARRLRRRHRRHHRRQRRRTSTSTGPCWRPGFGAQGGTVDDLRRIFGPVARHVLPSSSREVLSAGPDPTALRDAARRGNDAVAALGDA